MIRVPFDELFGAMDAIFDDAGVPDSKYSVPSFPPSEVLKFKDGTIEISLAVAGYKKDQISINTAENKIIVSTVDNYKPAEVEASLLSANRIKRSAFKSSFVVPEYKFNFAEIKASFEDGLLTITIPPKEKKEYKTVEIQ
jgi:HSP20 family molecular chaperone IbpA